ncbi:YihY/virulence factor BrkB family protein [uncultured Clostridium sp.]|uniref:YihY/virulence factor BrkB family protein n=1 Tax=uncultured Clostridium sp. TaxID=59620 RepID=UPI0025F426E6|nr:YihY/virulence factor BrkB family protein [uncultured Clostridium sp.]
MLEKFKEFSRNVYDIMMKPEMLTLPSSLAYYFVLSIVPIISLLLMIASSFNLSANFLIKFFENNFSSELVKMITPLVTNQSFSLGFVIYILVAFFLASNGSDAIIVTSNQIFNIDNKNYFRRRLKAFFLTIILFLLFTFMLIVPVFGEQLINIAAHIGFNSNVTDSLKMLYPVLNLPITLIVLYFGIKLIFIIAPDEKIKSSYVNKGAIFTTLCWVIVTNVYAYYLKHIATYSVYYAGLSTIVMLMVWFYFLAFVFVMGLSFNYRSQIEHVEKTNAIKLKEIEEKVKASKKLG